MDPEWRHRLALLACISAGFLSLWGCAGFGKVTQAPRISLSNIQVQEVKDLEAVFLVDLRVINTNNAPITTRGIDCDIEINGRRFASGVSNATIEIPALGATTVPMVVYSSVLDMVRGVLGLQGSEKLKYTISGRLHLQGGFLLPWYLPFKSAGELSLGETPGSP